MFLSTAILLKHSMVLRCRVLWSLSKTSDSLKTGLYPCQTGLSIFPSVARHLIKTGCINSCLFYGPLRRASTW